MWKEKKYWIMGRIQSCRFLRIFTVVLLLFLVHVGGSNPDFSAIQFLGCFYAAFLFSCLLLHISFLIECHGTWVCVWLSVCDFSCFLKQNYSIIKIYTCMEVQNDLGRHEFFGGYSRLMVKFPKRFPIPMSIQ